MRLSRLRLGDTVTEGTSSRINRMINRRTFTKSVVASAGAAGLTSVPLARAAEPDTGATTAPTTTATEPSPRAACVADYQELARLKLPRATYEYITAGSTD